jgi:hypothetical protein
MDDCLRDFRRRSLPELASLVYRVFGHKLSAEEIARYLDHGTFCPSVPAARPKNKRQNRAGIVQ